MAREIPVSNGTTALVDDDDYESVMAAGPWHGLKRANGSPGAVMHDIRRPDGARTLEPLHRFLMGRRHVDHRNGDPLDNRRVNLRPATVSQNCRNRRVQSNNKSGYKGVYYSDREGIYIAQIGYRKRRYRLGRFEDPIEAALAYDMAARRMHKGFARLNFPGPGEVGARSRDPAAEPAGAV